MREQKLISMVDFVLEHFKENFTETGKGHWEPIKMVNVVMSYANFLKQPLTLGMFIPCDEEGKPFSEWEIDEELCETILLKRERVFAKDLIDLAEQYQKAKERVLFKGYNVESKTIKDVTYYNITYKGSDTYYSHNSYPDNNPSFNGRKTIQDLIKDDVDLTQTAQTQIGINKE